MNLAELINYHMNDPRIEGMVTVSEVVVSDDLANATVGITALQADDARLRTLVRALQSAAGKLRSMLGDRVEMRVLPQLRFRVDEHAIRTRETLEAIARAMQNTRPLEQPPADQSPTEPDKTAGG